MKELNLLPENYKFDFEKYSLIKKILIIFGINLFLIIIVSAGLFFSIKNEKKILKKSNYILNSIRSINNEFIPFLREYKMKNKKIAEIEKMKKMYYINYQVKYSPLLSLLIFLKSLNKGINISTLQYHNGLFFVDGIAQSNKQFYNYYKNLKNNLYIKNVEFISLKKDKDNNLNFKLKIFVKMLD